MGDALRDAYRSRCVDSHRSWRVYRVGLRYTVVQVTGFPNGVAGVPVRPFEHDERRFWRRRSAIRYAIARAVGANEWESP